MSHKLFFPLAAFLLPFFFYSAIFFGRSFGLECATGVMGFKPPYQQTVTEPNKFCGHMADVGAYAWQHVPQGIKVGTEYASVHFPLWNQNSGIGVPLAANFISTAFFIPYIPFLFFKSIFAFDLFIVFRMSIAALGMYLFVRSLGLPKPLSLLSSLLVFLNGYMSTLPSISHQSVDILLPWIGFLITVAAKKKEIKYFVALAFVTALSHLGANPESSLFVALFFVAYSAFISLFVYRERFFALTVFFVLALFFSFILSSLLILPGKEFIDFSSNIHEPGIKQLYSAPFANVIFFIYPYILGLLRNPAYSEVVHWQTPNYIGAFFSFFLIYPVFLIIELRFKLTKLFAWKYFLFFIVFLLFLSIQYLSIADIPLFSRAPGFSQTNFPKYSLSLINMLIAVIVSFSIFYQHTLVEGAGNLRDRISRCVPLIVTLTVFLLITLTTYKLLGPIALKYDFYDRFRLQILIGVGVVISLFVLSFLKNARLKYLLFFFLVALELFIYLPYLRGDSDRRDSLRKPPAIEKLQNLDYKESRIFSPDYILYPDFSAAFDINDVRDLNALWPKTYYNYLKEFVVPEIDKAAFRFTGIREAGASTNASFTNNVYFDLLSTKYLLSYNDVNAYEELQNLSHIFNQFVETPSLRSEVFTVEGKTRSVLFQHAPGLVSLTINKPDGAKYFFIYPALSEKIFNSGDENDGVKFIAKATAEGKTIFERELTINPKLNKEDQKWFEFVIGPFDSETKKFDLLLQTDPLSSNHSDWSGWGGFEWDTEKDVQKTYQYKKIYDKEMKIYENTRFIPRLHAVREVKCVNKEEEIFPAMRENTNQITNLGIVFDSNCKTEIFETSEVKLKNQIFDDHKVSFEYSSQKPTYLVLSNLHYPGWKLIIDGKELPIERVNYTFQGLRLPKADDARVEVVYQPKFFRLGLGLTILGLVICSFVVIRFGNHSVDSIKNLFDPKSKSS